MVKAEKSSQQRRERWRWWNWIDQSDWLDTNRTKKKSAQQATLKTRTHSCFSFDSLRTALRAAVFISLQLQLHAQKALKMKDEKQRSALYTLFLWAAQSYSAYHSLLNGKKNLRIVTEIRWWNYYNELWLQCQSLAQKKRAREGEDFLLQRFSTSPVIRMRVTQQLSSNSQSSRSNMHRVLSQLSRTSIEVDAISCRFSPLICLFR